MGFYPAACMVTGLDLRELDAYLIPLLEQPGAGYHPFALPIHGSYDYYGGIDTVPYELVTLLDDFVIRCLRSGRLDLDQTKIHLADSFQELAHENHVALELSGRHACHLDNRGLAYALISQGAWDATVEIGTPHAAAPYTSPYFTEIYGNHLPDWPEPLRALSAVNAALPLLGLQWQWPESIGDSESHRRLTTARTTFAHLTAFHPFLDHYQQLLGAPVDNPRHD
ncbi:hypothetical protein [Kribbella swartbergensis]